MNDDKTWRALTLLVAEMTGLAPASLSRGDNIFALGVDSLGLLKIGQEVEKRFQAELPLSAMADELSTLSAIADWLTGHAGQSAALLESPAPVPQPPPTPQPIAPSPSSSPSAAPSAADPRLALAVRQMEDFLALSRLQWDELRSPASASGEKLPAAPPSLPPPPRNLRGFRLEPDRLDAVQERFVTELVRRHVARTAASKAHTSRHRPHFADWKHTLGFRTTLKEAFYPIVAASAKGGRFRDLDGNDYLDIALGMGVNYLGHAPDFVTAAVAAALSAGMPLGPQNADAGEAAGLLAELTGMERVAWANTGSESVMFALRLARARTGRARIVLFGGSYHGVSDGVLAMSTPDGTAPASAGVPTGAVSDVTVLEYGSDGALAEIDRLGSELAAVLVEPVQSRKPALQPTRFLRRLRRLADTHGFALIFDEMITGLRIHAGGAQVWFGVKADLACYGKILGGGVPVSAVAGSRRFLDGIDGGQWAYGDDSLPSAEASGIVYGGTYCRHPLAMAAAKAVLTHFKTEGPALHERTNALAARLCDTLNLFFEREAVPVRVERFAAQFRFESFGRYNLLLQPLEMDLLFLLLMELGVYTWERRICFISTAHDERDVDFLVAAVKRAVTQLRSGGFAFRSEGDAPVRFFPMTPAQLRVFAVMERPGAGLLNHLTAAFAVEGDFDAARMEDAVADVIARHEALRTSLHLIEGEPVQKVWPEPPFRLERYDGLSLDAFAARFVRPFDLACPPLLRAAVARLCDGRTILAFDLHHAVADGMSLDIIAREVAENYADSGGLSASPPRQYREFHADIAGTRHLDITEKLSASWREELSSPPPELRLPKPCPADDADGADGSSGSAAASPFAGGKVFARWGRERTAHARSLARRHGVTPFMLHAALLGLALRRLTGCEDFYIGTAAAARPAGSEGTVGMFANTLPLRLSPERGLSLGEYMRSVRQNCLAAFSRQDCPFEIVSGQAPDQSRPLFTVMLPYEHAATARTTLAAGLSFTPVDISTPASFYDLNWEIIEEDGATQFKIGYRDAAPGRALAERLLALYDGIFDEINLLPDAADGSGPRIAGIDGLPPAERVWLMQHEDVAAAVPPSAPQDFAAAWQRALLHENDNAPPAVVTPDGEFTRRELDSHAEELAGQLRSLGLRPGGRVATLLPPGETLAAAALAVWRAGGVYMPLDPAHPEARNRELIRRLGAAALIDPDGRVRPQSPGDDGAADAFVTDASAASGADYVFFTSGSTGEPKAVQGGLAGVMHFLEWENSLVAGAAPLRVAWLARPSFDASLRDIFLPLLYGGTLFCPDAATRENPAALARWISKNGITVLHAVPSVFRLLAEAWRDGDAVLSELRWALLAGEALTGAEIDRWRALAPGAKFVNLYGPTETTMVKTFSVLDGPLPAGVLAVGRAIPGSRVYVVDAGWSAGEDTGEPDGLSSPVLRTPRGAWGEVWLAGAGVTAGYFGEPAETARRFVSDPFGGAEARAYRTGDLGRWRDDGQLEILGRLDRQVKIHGVRVDPEETRRALLALPGVTEAAVVAIDDAADGKALAAYFTGSASVETIRDGLRRRLPAAFLPRYVTCLPAMPLTRTGKVDFGRLPPPATLPACPAAVAAVGGEGELSPVELRLQGMFAEVLGMPSAQIPAASSFFALGGHSLAAMRLIGKIHAAFGVSLAMADIFRFDSVAALAGCVEARTLAAPPDGGGVGEDDFGPAEEIVVLTPAERAELGL